MHFPHFLKSKVPYFPSQKGSSSVINQSPSENLLKKGVALLSSDLYQLIIHVYVSFCIHNKLNKVTAASFLFLRNYLYGSAIKGATRANLNTCNRFLYGRMLGTHTGTGTYIPVFTIQRLSRKCKLVN